jgi:hypothetical protein
MLTITLLSLVVAAASGFFAWQSIRREHLRSHARVASLAAALDDQSPPRRAAGAGPAFEDPFLSVPALEFPSEAEASGAPVSTLTFDAMDAEPSVRRRVLGVVAGAAVVVAGVVSIAMMSDRYEPSAPRVVSPHAESLELLSLDASRDGSTLAVSGLVRSRTEEPLAFVTAVVSAIDAKGRPVGRASVPLADIMPRREARFVVTIADVTEAARYRVSFRSATGIIRHVDRRAIRSSSVS